MKCRSKVALRRQAEGRARHLFTAWGGLPLPTGVLQQLLHATDGQRGDIEESRARAERDTGRTARARWDGQTRGGTVGT